VGPEIAWIMAARIDEVAMPNKLPIKPRAKAIHARDSVESIDWLALWAISLGVCAVVLAATALFVAADKIGAVFILVGVAALIALILKGSDHGYL
jgi:uncharacterized membrane protein HdeD (DUF308 family)